MQETTLKNWDEFEAELQKLFAYRKDLINEGRKGVSAFLCRGLACYRGFTVRIYQWSWLW